LPVLLAAPWNSILPAFGLKQPASTFYRRPISAGPYMVESMASDGTNVTLGVNPNYAGAKPVVPRVIFTDVEDENTRRIQLQGNQIDVAGELDPTALQQLKGDGITVTVNPQFGGYYIWMSDRKPPLSNANVRRAISTAVDRQQMNTVIWAGQNRPLGGLLPSTMPGHEENIPTARDLQKAKQLLAGTPCASGCRIGIMVRNGRPVDQKSALILKQDLQQIGIDVAIEQVDNGVASKRESDGSFDMEIEWLGLPLPVPDTYLTYAVVSDGGIQALFSGYHSAQMDAAAKQVMRTSGAARAAALTKVNAIFARDLPYVPLYDYAQVLAWHTDVQPYLKYTPSGYFEVASR
jgi:peptide/nickel transport system substrate-binding protein